MDKNIDWDDMDGRILPVIWVEFTIGTSNGMSSEVFEFVNRSRIN